MEGALKMVRAHGHKINAEKFEIVSLDNSFHGRTFGALSITGQPKYRKDFEPLLPGVKYVRRGDVEALEAAVGERTAGIVIEVIQGEGGIYPAGEAFLRKAKELSERFNALLVFDEIQCGVGPSGHVLRVSARERDDIAGCDGGGEADCVRAAAGHDYGERESGGGDRAGHARVNVRRQRAGVPGGVGVLRYFGRDDAGDAADRGLLQGAVRGTGRAASIS